MSTLVDNTGRTLRRGGLLVVILGACLLLTASTARAQSIGYIDSDQILEQMPEYAALQKKVDRLVGQWRGELKKKQNKVQAMSEEYQARELLYTEEKRKKKRAAIREARKNVEQLRTKYFGPKGQLFTRQKELMRPLQERILNAVETVAQREGYDYVFDKAGGEVLFMYASSEYDLNDAVLEELGIDIDQTSNRGG